MWLACIQKSYNYLGRLRVKRDTKTKRSTDMDLALPGLFIGEKNLAMKLKCPVQAKYLSLSISVYGIMPILHTFRIWTRFFANRG